MARGAYPILGALPSGEQAETRSDSQEGGNEACCLGVGLLMHASLFTLPQAREALSTIRSLTEQAVAHYEEVLQSDDDRADTLASCVAEWALAVDRLGGLPRGLWRVEFDNGVGFLSWRWPESKLDHYRLYDSTIERRLPIH